MAAVLAITPATAGPAQAADPCGAGGNKIACENSKPGSPSEVWDINGAGDSGLQGFATDISVNVGGRIDFKIDTLAAAYDITIYRSGYYGGAGAREIARISPSAALPQRQPQCITDVVTELYDCGNWAVSASWNVPATAVSGVYFALLVDPATTNRSHITFVVRDDASQSDIVFQTSDTTWQAYNTYGGSNFYTGGVNGRAYKISYNRPVLTRGTATGRDFYFGNEYPLVRFLEKNGYDVSYIAGVDTDRRGGLLTNHKTFLSVGHDEYWSGQQRSNVEAARDAGVNLMFLSGNEMYWRTRYESSADPSNTPYRTLVSYKETWAHAKIDPNANEWTGTWRDPRFAAPSTGAGRPENGLTGTMYMVNFSDLAMKVKAEEGKLRLWRNTSLASLAAGTTATLAPHTVGYESNEDVDNGSRPEGLVRLSTTTGAVPEYLQDFGTIVKPGTTTHHMTMYRAPGGALVFSAGTVQWTWGLDEQHDSEYALQPADRRMQQAQVNLLADMSAQPTTLDPQLTAATKSTDTTGPTISISSPAEGSRQPNGGQVTLDGTAADSGGRVAGVEVSTDGGTTWHPATGTTTWSYTYIQHGRGATPIRVRGIDDSANIGTAATRTLDVPCPCSVFGNEVPAQPAVSDPVPVELGLRVKAEADGYLTGVRFYKGPGNTGTHVGSVWDTTGQRLASATFTNETASGWQTVSFTSPVEVLAGQTTVVSYSAPSGNYAALSNAFWIQGLNSYPLSVAGGFGTAPAGVYGGLGTFPSQSYQRAHYYVDALFSLTDDTPLTANSRSPLPGSSSVQTDTTIKAKFSKPVRSATVAVTLVDPSGTSVAGTTSYDATTRVVTFQPTAPLNGFVKYTVTLTADDNQGVALSAGGTWSFTTAKPPSAPGVCPCTLFDDGLVPTLLEASDTVPVTLGVRFASEVDGTITGVRFYKGQNNTGPHTGSLWAMNGTELATGTFTNESTSGWQTLVFNAPVSITKNTEYLASYRAPVGRYSANVNEFATTNLSRSPLRVAPDSGAYTYGTGMPTAPSNHNYLVDVVFERLPATLSVTAQDPASGALDVPRTSSVGIWFSSSVRSGYTFEVRNGSTILAGTTAFGPRNESVVFTPSQPLPRDADVTATVSGIVSTEGVTLPPQTWTFRTSTSLETDQPQTLFGSTLPQVYVTDDSTPIELGTAFTPTVDGRIT
ncbi:MAG: N,N-dimethylformamidase beta subunit family domain-containing protein, partial [Nocardioides sp.]